MARIRAMRPVISLCIVLRWILEAATSKERRMSEDKVGLAKILRGGPGVNFMALTLEQQFR